MIKTPGTKATIVRGPFVRTPVLGPKALDRQLEVVFSQPCYSTPELIEAEEQERHQRLFAKAEPEIETSKGPVFKPIRKRKKGR